MTTEIIFMLQNEIITVTLQQYMYFYKKNPQDSLYGKQKTRKITQFM